jgi:hypothetical protein
MTLSRDPKPVSRCKICLGAAELFDVVDFNKFCNHQPYNFGLSGQPVYYLRCLECGFIFTRHCDNWSKETFAERIYNADYIKVDGEYADTRPKREAARFVASVPNAANLSVLDFGSGTGVFSRHAASLGVANIASYDPFSTPTKPAGEFDVATAIEVLEHTPDPLNTVSEILSFMKDDCVILFTTLLQPNDICEVRAKHWYIGPRNGHISIYNGRSLSRLGSRLGLSFTIDEPYLAFSRGATPIRLKAKPLICVDLLAPLTPSAKGWNAIENGHRWTSSEAITWKISISHEARVLFVIPIKSEVRTSFANECRLECESSSVEFTRSISQHGYELSAAIDLPEGDHLATLHTPVPLSPRYLRGAPDERPLGLLVRCQT